MTLQKQNDEMKSDNSRYSVRAGDSLSKIAKNYLNDAGRWREIYKLNEKELHGNPNKLAIGQQLVLPVRASNPAETECVSKAPAVLPPKGHVSVTQPVKVSSAETLLRERLSSINLTFDDGPNLKTTPQILDILKEYNANHKGQEIQATFFVIGKNVDGIDRSNDKKLQIKELMQRIVNEGHTLGNHTYDHKNLPNLSEAEIGMQLDKTQEAVDNALGYHYPLKLVRPPRGEKNEKVENAIASRGEDLVLWSVDSRDWSQKISTEKVFSNILEGEHSIYRTQGPVLFHDIYPRTVQVVKALLGRGQEEFYPVASASSVSSNNLG